MSEQIMPSMYAQELAAQSREIERLRTRLAESTHGHSIALHEIDRLMRERDAAEAERDDLLARIHRDGGHYVLEHGVKKACADADLIVANLYAERDDLLGALRAVLASVTCEDDGGFCSVCGKCHDEAAPGCWANRARAAIAKVSSKGDDK